MITKIEGLDSLTKLQDLTLFSNKIEHVSGLENLPELNVLSLGNNLIQSHSEVVDYLRKIENKLEVLTLMGNPCIKENENEYRMRVVAYLPKLKYIDYSVIEKEFRT